MNAHSATGRLYRRPLPVTLAMLTAGAWLSGPCLAGQLTYVPVNPSFGGNPLNGSYLLQSAQAQKSYPYPMDDLGLDGTGDYKILNAGNAPIIQVGNSVYLYDSAKGQWVAFDPDSIPSSTPSTSADASISATPPAGAADIDSGVLR